MKQRMQNSYEKGLAIYSASSLALLPRGTQRSVDRGIGGVGIELRKVEIRTPTVLISTEGNMNGDVSASLRSVRRSRRPQARLETSYTRSGRPQRHLLPNQTAGRRAKAIAVRPARTSRR